MSDDFIKELAAAESAAIARANKANTKKSYRLAVGQFDDWRAARRHEGKTDNGDISALARLYLCRRANGDCEGLRGGEFITQRQFGSVATLNVHISALKAEGILLLAGPRLRNMARGLANIVQERAAPRQQAAPLRAPVLRKILNAPAANLAHERGKTLCALGWLGLLRLDDLRHLRAADVSPAAIKIRQSKTNRAGEVATINLAGLRAAAALLPTIYPAARQVAAWQTLRAKIAPVDNDRPHLFVAADSQVLSRLGQQISATTALADIRAAGMAAGLAPDDISGHSMRRGGAQDFQAGGMGTAEIMRHGRWRRQNQLPDYLINPPPTLPADINETA